MAPYASSTHSGGRQGGLGYSSTGARCGYAAVYEATNLKMNPPRVLLDNDSDESATILTVDSANKQGCLLEVVQLLTDLGLVITKAQISSDGGWFVDVFHVTDDGGGKVTDPGTIAYIQQTLGAVKVSSSPINVPKAGKALPVDSVKMMHAGIELSGKDRPGLLHELATEIATLGCSVLAAEVWTHNGRVAFVIYVTESSGAPVTSSSTLAVMKSRLMAVMETGGSSQQRPQANIIEGSTHAGRRMHQIMFEERDYESGGSADVQSESILVRPQISVRSIVELGYSILNIKCLDRPKLLFDTVCTLTDMQYVIHHATIESAEGIAMQEYYLRSLDGRMVELEAERNRLVKCLQAAIQRHTRTGTCLELCASDRVGLLADVTGIFKQQGISIAAATVSTHNGKAMNEFFVVGASGQPVDMDVLQAIQQQAGASVLAIRSPQSSTPGSPAREVVAEASPFSLAKLLRVQSERLLASLGLLSTSV